MTFSQLFQGMEILDGYYQDDDHTFVEAHPDQIFFPPTDHPLPEQDVKALKDLGFFQVEGKGKNAPYDHKAGWSHFT